MATCAEKIDLSQIYRFLAQSMRYPDSSWLNDSYIDVLSSLLQQLGWDNDLQEIQGISGFIPEFIDKLQVEHTRLFINAVPHVAAPPYASVYMDKAGQLYGKLAEKTKEYYRQWGFELVHSENPPDHIVHELEFLALVHKESQEGEETFLIKFFRPWFSIFSDRVLESAHQPFYQIILRLIVFFTREEP
jgi:TorA maturation chaperone TorD